MRWDFLCLPRGRRAANAPPRVGPRKPRPQQSCTAAKCCLCGLASSGRPAAQTRLLRAQSHRRWEADGVLRSSGRPPRGPVRKERSRGRGVSPMSMSHVTPGLLDRALVALSHRDHGSGRPGSWDLDSGATIVRGLVGELRLQLDFLESRCSSSAACEAGLEGRARFFIPDPLESRTPLFLQSLSFSLTDWSFSGMEALSSLVGVLRLHLHHHHHHYQ